MPRFNVQSDRVQNLVNQGLVPLFLASGTTAQLCKRLNSALKDDNIGRKLHPNRIHALLSDDLSRSVNEATLELVERAVEALKDADAWQDKAAKRSAELQAETTFLLGNRGIEPDAPDVIA